MLTNTKAFLTQPSCTVYFTDDGRPLEATPLASAEGYGTDFVQTDFYPLSVALCLYLNCKALLVIAPLTTANFSLQRVQP